MGESDTGGQTGLQSRVSDVVAHVNEPRLLGRDLLGYRQRFIQAEVGGVTAGPQHVQKEMT